MQTRRVISTATAMSTADKQFTKVQRVDKTYVILTVFTRYFSN